jgi:hypothetical protein
VNLFETIRSCVTLDRMLSTNGSGKARCVAPDHQDSDPSMHAYPDIVEHVVALLRREELHPWEVDRRSKRQTHPTLVVDNTGVGTPVTDLLTKKKVKFVGVTVTGGTSVTRLGAYKYGVPKRDLVSALDVPFHAGEFVIAEGLELRPTLEKELQGFKRKIKLDTGHDSYEHWREGDHDDLVLACALATWWARLRRGNTRLRLIR